MPQHDDINTQAAAGGAHAQLKQPSRYETAGIASRVSFAWVSPLISRGWKAAVLDEHDADGLLPATDDVVTLAEQFEQTYASLSSKQAAQASKLQQQQQQQGLSQGLQRARWQLPLTARVLLRLYWRSLLLHSFWVVVEIVVRLLSPLALRYFLIWLTEDAALGGSLPDWQGWALAVAVASSGAALTVIHHQFFFIGMRMGFKMRQQVVAAIHAKVLRLNSASVGAASAGHIINLASSDARRFDEGLSFWLFIWAGPLEAAGVLAMVSRELGFVPAIAGMAAMLAVIPAQALLVRTIAGLRRSTAQHTDERVRLTGEVIQGVLAMKMLGWEWPFGSAITAIRDREAVPAVRMSQIRGFNLSLQFVMAPVTAFVTFASYRALNGTLYLPSVMYALALLHLPKLTLVYFAVIGFQYMTETSVAVQRIDAFLSLPEPPPPVHMQPAQQQHATDPGSPAGRRSSSDAPQQRRKFSLELLRGKGPDQRRPPHLALASHQGQQVLDAAAGAGVTEYSVGHVELRGADYDWDRNIEEMAAQDTRRQLAGPHAAALAAVPHNATRQQEPPPAAAAVAAGGRVASDATLSQHTGSQPSRTGSSGNPPRPGPPRHTLSGVRLVARPGALLAVVGEVGAGKSSLLAALLGELLPMRGGADGRNTPGGPVVVGRVSYCSQVPWIMAATIRENITFQQPFDQIRYDSVIAACALEQDLVELEAGDATELGERGINLSGGQKARVALARAAYADADVALLDDPLSAVDPRVGRTLFDACIGPHGLMAGRTRILVTHQRQYLPACDTIAVLRCGELVAVGTWADLAPLELPELLGGGEADASLEAAAAGVVAGSGGGAGRGRVTDASVSTSNNDVSDSDDDGDDSSDADYDDNSLDGTSGDDSLVIGNGRQPSKSVTKNVQNGAAKSFPLSRSRTMAPDVNGRPLDSGSWHHSAVKDCGGGGSGGNISSNMHRSLSRMISRSFTRATRGNSSTAAVAPSGGSILLLRLQRSVSGLFVPPAYLPGGERYIPPSLAAAAAAAELVRRDTMNSLRRRARHSGEGGAAAVAESALPALEPSAASLAAGGGAQGAAVAVLQAAARKRSHYSADSGRPGGSSGGALVMRERREAGGVTWAVYRSYVSRLGPVMVMLMVLGLVSGQAVFLASEWWLALWAAAPPEHQTVPTWLLVYGLLTLGVIVIALARSSLFFWAAMRAATRLHGAMLAAVLRAPLSFFHTNPTGRVLNRFSNDQGRVDDVLPLALFDVLQTGLVCLGAFVLVAVAVPFIMPVFGALLVAFYFYRQRYITTSREVKRWDATSRSPVFASFAATLKGLPTIRAYGAEKHFHSTFLQHMSASGRWWFAYLATSRWIGFRLDTISSITLAATALLAMAVRGQVSPPILGLALTHVLQLTGMLQWWTRQTVEVENNMTCVERMEEYSRLPAEPLRVADGAPAPPHGWPAGGALRFDRVTARYRPGLPPVLRQLSFELKPGTSCGVVGRTGSGKSSLMLSLFRLIELTRGAIYLDGVDTATIGLDALRQQLAIIPQDPVLFSGTLRSNLDPWGEHSDAALWRVLGAVQLKGVVAAAGGLDARMAEAGDNLSVGQRQLFCLARALLQEARVLALDEATANVDRATDALIQRSLAAFTSDSSAAGAGRVLLVIAHRVDTILDCDHLLVLAHGKLVEQGAPRELAAAQGGMFSGMVSAAAAAAAGSNGGANVSEQQ